MLKILFIIFTLLALAAAIGVVTAKNPVRAVLSLIVTFVATAGCWMTLHAEFLSLVLIVVYVGAVMVLFLFVVMMLDIEMASLREGFVRLWPLMIWVPLIFVALVYHTLHAHLVLAAASPTVLDDNNIVAIANALFSNYLYPLEIAGVVLLVAMMAAIMLTFRRKDTGDKKQRISVQVATQASSRLRLVDMPFEKKGDKS